ncbi:hypothetical protein AKJ55_01790 [candidate division MSBL1 archaeon SCGC-AAA382M17]|uniref:Uncharacterized protein n=1 Tax=candidate division MSBL1 archaeon SCGC-AAA382M17 TaxID=1698284 RepID=A0ABR5TJV2_9EURY|nr:hypothetical protein AKJ55_01790 [candidate division MSBL1 archaeon SCGC-AAA382M17]
MAKTTIQVKQETRERLQGVGSKGETYDDIIMDLIAAYESRLEELERRAKAPDEEYVSFERVKEE